MSTKTIEGWPCPLTDGCHCGKESHPVAPAHWMDGLFHADKTRTTRNRMFNYQSQVPCGCGSEPEANSGLLPCIFIPPGHHRLLKTSTVPFYGLPNNVVTSISELLHAEAHKNCLCIKASHLYLGSQGDLLIKSARNELLGIICQASN